jgi:hypothetical protein
MAECPWCWHEICEQDAVMSAKNGLLYHEDCLDEFNEVTGGLDTEVKE